VIILFTLAYVNSPPPIPRCSKYSQTSSITFTLFHSAISISRFFFVDWSCKLLPLFHPKFSQQVSMMLMKPGQKMNQLL
jgi:hypothetical protein